MGTGSKGNAKSKNDKSSLLIQSVRGVFYWSVQLSIRLLAVGFFDVYCTGRQHTTAKGGALVLSSHQSHLDPVLVGITFTGRLNYLARRTLFDNKLLGLTISLLDAIELDRERGGLAGLKETIKRLRDGKKVLIFPEGTRSHDGKLAPLKPGFMAVARRSKVPLVPMVITGAFEALPRTSNLPLRYPLRISVGKEISVDQVAEMEEGELIKLIEVRLAECYRTAQNSR